AITGQPYASAYVASKAAIRGLSDSVRQEVADVPGIHVCTVLPYAIDTPIYQRAANYSGRDAQPVFPRYSAQTVAKTVIRLVRHPRREVYAGRTGLLAALNKMVSPQLSDLIVRGAVNTIELGDGETAPSAGNAFRPVHDQWKVSGGWTVPKGRLAVPAVAVATAATIWLVAKLLRRPSR
ncbi:MAG: short-chain dehydrogenase, partial [Devosia sp.]|nr:short-chain dehydrogenase [Devosia sp.]